MHNKIKKFWFSQSKRTGLASFIQEQLNEASLNMTDFSLYDQDNLSVNYKTSVLGAWLSVLQLVKYIAVNSKTRRPWLAHRRIKEPLELNQFKSYIDEVIGRLNTMPPSTNYSALVHVQTVINILTTMEYQDGR